MNFHLNLICNNRRPLLSTSRILLVTALLGLMSPAHAESLPVAGNDQAALVAKLTKLSDDWDKAIVRKDRAAIAANMADDFRQIDGDGNVETKASFVDELVSPDLTIHPYTVEDFDVRIYGEVALLCGRTRMNGTFKGKDFISHYRYIDIYVRRDNVWKIVSVQISKNPN